MNRAASNRSGWLRSLLVLVIFFFVSDTTGADARGLAEQGQIAFGKGSFGEASALWEKALESFRSKGNQDAEIQTSISLAGAYQSLGQQQRAVHFLEDALARADKSANKRHVTVVKSKLGAALVITRQTDRANLLLREALEEAKADRNSKLTAEILNDLGNLLVTQQSYPEALSAYEESVALARQAGNSWLAAQGLCNSAAAAARAGQFERADALNSRALQEIEPLEESHAKAFFLLTAGQTDVAVYFTDAEAVKRVQLRAQKSFQQALEAAERMRDRSVETYALGYLAEMYELDRQPETALKLNRRAAFIAQEAQIPEALYRWERQMARVLRTQGNTEPAIAAYRRAIQTLQSIRADVSVGNGNALVYRSFRESEGPLFLELADLLLEKSKAVSDAADEQAFLLEAREVVEQLKAVELESYLCDDCVDALKSRRKAVEAVDKETAVIYLVSLPTRTELLVGLTSGLKRFTVQVRAEELTAEVRQLRLNLETRTSYEYLAQAQKLYDWIIRPVRSYLREHEVTTLVFVPDGAIRTVPLATLHDGEKFLIQDLAVAVVPGLSMVEPQPIELGKARMLLNGLSESVQGFEPLNFVTGEIKNIEQSYQSETLLNSAFTISSLTKKLTTEQYPIVHIASHGQFNRDVRKTFVLTHDSKLTLNDLEAVIRPSQYRGKPVELLVLSACQTAAGDDRAALGLAGIAVKAGARSALATLWFVNDQSTSELVAEVYRQLQKAPRVSKAKALQAAQLKLLSDRRFRHPCYWSPYLVVGNWL